MFDAKTATFEEAEAYLASQIYKASAMLEQLEYAGKLRGNGHHARQKLATHAIEDLKDRWIPKPHDV